MTPEEAIIVLKEDKELYESDIVSAFDGTPEGELIGALDMAISELEKQIPKKPRAYTVDVEKLKIGNANWCKGTTVYRCPSCNDFISRIYDFCYKCGQALDWRETE